MLQKCTFLDKRQVIVNNALSQVLWLRV
jgi:hypothetical protein